MSTDGCAPGGVDLTIETKLEPAEVYRMGLEVIREYWPNLVTQDASYEEKGVLVDEGSMFIYRDQEAKDIWDAEGASEEEPRNDMIYLYGCREGSVSLVVDDAIEVQTVRIIEKLVEALEGEIVYRSDIDPSEE